MDIILNCFKKIAENEKVTISALENKIGASKGVLSRAIANNTDIQSKWLAKLIETYPQYNFDWLLTGRGDMIFQNSAIIDQRLQAIQDLKDEDQERIVATIDALIELAKSKK